MRGSWIIAACVVAATLGVCQPAQAFDYEVRPGDTLFNIARRFGVTVGAIRSSNDLRGDLIRAGSTIVIPVSSPDPHDERSISGPRHEVVRGDNLHRLSRRYGVSVERIITANRLSSSLLRPGTWLVIPGVEMIAASRLGTQVPRAELEVLARIVKGETIPGTPFHGQVAVAAVVLNRVLSRRFPNTITDVAQQPMQFSCYNRNNRSRLYDGPVRDGAWRAARAALQGQDPVSGATHYYNPYLVQPSWSNRFELVRRIGEKRTTTHDFYRRPRPAGASGASELLAGEPMEPGSSSRAASSGIVDALSGSTAGGARRLRSGRSRP